MSKFNFGDDVIVSVRGAFNVATATKSRTLWKPRGIRRRGMSEDMRRAFRAGWDAREARIGIIQPTDARDEFYGTPRRARASIRPVKYHASIFTNWRKAERNDHDA